VSSWLRVVFALAGVCLLGLGGSLALAQAQAPGVAVPAAAAPAGGPAGDGNFYRLGFFTLDLLAFKQHPFFQLTGNGNFDNGKGATNTTLTVGDPSSDKNTFLLLQWLHSLPSFYAEGGKTFDLFLPKAITFGVDSFRFSQKDVQAAVSGTVPPIQMDVWLYEFGVRAFAFDPTQPGINYYVGLALGILQGELTAQPFAGQSPQIIDFGQTPTGSLIMGLEAKGNNFGLRYELQLFNATQVKFTSNPYQGSPTTIDFSGSITRLAVFYQF
jgi:hypothetical protein